MIDPATVRKIKDSADIVDVVSDYVHLVRRGANYMGLCPFHNERTPSFSVNKNKNFCYCFSCHKGGSPVNFIMEKEGISYHEALLQLAKKYGIEVLERELTDEEKKEQTLREGMFVANEWAKNYFVSNLHKEEGKNIGLTYIYGRQVTPEAIKAFALGYVLDKSTDFTDAALRQGFSIDILKLTGLTGVGGQGNYYDRFRGRVIFPIINTAGKTVAFGGRDLKGASAKYINSPESEIYSKSRELYGIFQAKGDMVKENKCYLVEGYLDVIGLWQSGIKNVVASSGTALTDGQISLIHRFTDNVTLIYDGDPAGIKASLRGLDMLLAHNLNVKAVLLPEGEDPDSLSHKLSSEELKKFLKENETDIIRFKIKVLMDEVKDDPQKKWAVVRSLIESIANIPDKIKRDIYIQECGNLLDIKESTLSGEINKARFKIIEQERFKRRVNDIEKSFPETGETNPNEVRQRNKQNTKNVLFPLEKELLLNCLKYGFVALWKNEEPDNEANYTTVVEYIAEELEIDGLSFTTPEFNHTFISLINLLPEFKKELENNETRIENKVKLKREEGFKKIASRSISVNEIKKEEKLLEDNLEEFVKQERKEFAKNYILNKFGSHEDETIRRLTNEAYAEKHQLSSLFQKNQSLNNSNDKVISIIINSLNVLKNGIIDRQLKTLMEELKNIEEDNTEKEKELHLKISEIIKMRSRMAKDIGDRILSPVTLKILSKKNAPDK